VPCGAAPRDPRQRSFLCSCGARLLARYDLERARGWSRGSLTGRAPDMWRYRELLPLFDGETPVTLGEGGTPLLALPRLAAHFGLRTIWGKDEGQNPTGSFKARGLGMAITRARTLGARGFIIPSAGNAGGAAAVYAARCGLPCAVIVPRATPRAAVAEAAIAGARVFTVDGTIATAGRVVAKVAPQLGWFDLSTLKEPYRLEGKKTMGLELAEQLDWTPPDWLLYPTGGGTGLVGIPKAFDELRAIGWVGGSGPRYVAVQGEGCAPVVDAFLSGAETTTGIDNPPVVAAGLRVPSPFAGRQMLKVLRESGGDAVAVGERAITEAQRLLARLEGIWTSPEGAALVAALGILKDRRRLTADARVVIMLTGAGIKYEAPELPTPIDLAGSPDEAPGQVIGVLSRG